MEMWKEVIANGALLPSPHSQIKNMKFSKNSVILMKVTLYSTWKYWNFINEL